jgi:hypothetical protein
MITPKKIFILFIIIDFIFNQGCPEAAKIGGRGSTILSKFSKKLNKENKIFEDWGGLHTPPPSRRSERPCVQFTIDIKIWLNF